jgi:predicted DCC family thiol-disulfide oxidoreductase YuxK
MTEQPIILFDGVCNLCNGFVQFVIRRDPKAVFKFAPLQGEFGNSIRAKQNAGTKELKTVILFQNNKIYTRSTAALQIIKQLESPLKWLYGFIIVPLFIRDGVYNLVSRNRYKWFGKKDECMVPTPELAARFLN